MFSGIVESVGKVQSRERRGAITTLRLSVGKSIKRLKKGESLAVNGVCLTVRALGRRWVECDLLDETLRRTHLGSVRSSDPVNLERSLRLGDRVGGHFLSGHVDTCGQVLSYIKKGGDRILRIGFPKPFQKLVVEKGSLGVDGVSLTVVRVGTRDVSIHLIPHTLRNTTLGQRRKGDRVHLEFDIMAKYLWKWRYKN